MRNEPLSYMIEQISENKMYCICYSIDHGKSHPYNCRQTNACFFYRRGRENG